MMQPGNSMVPPPQYQQQPPQQPWMPQQPQQPQYQVPPPQQPPAGGYYYQQPPPQAPAGAVPPPHQYAAAGMAQAQPVGDDGIRSLWIGDLQYWMDEQYLYTCFASGGEVVTAKVIRNKQTGQSEGYGFIEFASHAAAERNLQTYNGALMPNVEQTFRMNWASMGAGEKRDDGPEHTIFVGDLAADVTDYILQETFRVNYPSVKSAKVVTDRVTGRTKGYGFVKFGDESEQLRAMTEMNGQFCSSRPMRIGQAADKQKAGGQTQTRGCQEALSYMGLEPISAEMSSISGHFCFQLKASSSFISFKQGRSTIFASTLAHYSLKCLLFPSFTHLTIAASYQTSQGAPSEDDPTNTTIFVGNLDANVSDEHLRQVFGQYGQLLHVKIPVGKRCGFVQFADRSCAEEAIRMLSGTQLGGQTIRLSWGRSPANKQVDPNNQYGGGYYGYAAPGPGYETYGYAAPPAQDPNMYYGGYPGYGNYPQPPQQQQPQ